MTDQECRVASPSLTAIGTKERAKLALKLITSLRLGTYLSQVLRILFCFVFFPSYACTRFQQFTSLTTLHKVESFRMELYAAVGGRDGLPGSSFQRPRSLARQRGAQLLRCHAPPVPASVQLCHGRSGTRCS